jgi:hypothetical protein
MNNLTFVDPRDIEATRILEWDELNIERIQNLLNANACAIMQTKATNRKFILSDIKIGEDLLKYLLQCR